MIELGNSLRTAREAKGLSVRQLAELTRLAPTTIQELESENFSRIAAPIYGRGFIKLYCEAVGLDPKPHVAEFMELYNGNRESAIRERPTSAPAPASAALSDDSQTAAAERPVASAVAPEQEPLPTAEPEPLPTPDQEPMPADEPKPFPTAEPDLFRQVSPTDPETAVPAQEAPLSRYAAQIRHYRSALDLRAYLRLGVLAVGGIALLALVAFGIRAIYRATTQTGERAATEAVSASAQEPEKLPHARQPAPRPAAKERTERTPQKIPSLYID